MSTADFYEDNSQALRKPGIVLRDSLGVLAIHILKSKRDISKMTYNDIIQELYAIIAELHYEYNRMDLAD